MINKCREVINVSVTDQGAYIAKSAELAVFFYTIKLDANKGRSESTSNLWKKSIYLIVWMLSRNLYCVIKLDFKDYKTYISKLGVDLNQPTEMSN